MRSFNLTLLSSRWKPLFLLMLAFGLSALASCDMRSGTAKSEMEKYISSPTPPISPFPTPTPVDHADIAQVDTGVEGEAIAITGQKQNKTIACSKFNRVLVNGDDSQIKITGVCRQIMVNGDRNQITLDAAVEFVLNGSENTIKYSRLANGKQPSVIENRAGNTIEKVTAPAVTSGSTTRKITE